MINFAIEKLFHYKCTLCVKWWSVSDTPVPAVMNCPHCGISQRVVYLIDKGEVETVVTKKVTTAPGFDCVGD